MATRKERDCFEDNILSSIANNASKLKTSQLTGFLSMKGDRYNSELMVIGRAVNGWTTGITPSHLHTPISRKTYTDLVFNTVTKSHGCPMKWVSHCWGSHRGYNTKKSAFWRVIRSVTGNLGVANIKQCDWPSYLVWSNLYKISPEAGGNPSKTLCNVQLSGCRTLLDIELSSYTPKRLLFLTGKDWVDPFLGTICQVSTTNGQYVEASGNIVRGNQTTRVVVATHPQGKPENAWVQEVTKAF